MTFKVRIEDLYPYETSVIRSAVAKYEKAYRAGKEVDKPKVARVRGRLLVVDGNDRVYAALKAGRVELEVVDATPVGDQSREDILCRAARGRGAIRLQGV